MYFGSKFFFIGVLEGDTKVSGKGGDGSKKEGGQASSSSQGMGQAGYPQGMTYMQPQGTYFMQHQYHNGDVSN
jgi:hypothetical protein